MTKKIIFEDEKGVDDLYYPKSASSYLPEWYKKTNSKVDRSWDEILKNGSITNLTIKKCMPVFDAMSTGYIIPTYQDVVVYKDENKVLSFFWRQHDPVLEVQSRKQNPNYPLEEEVNFYKWVNPFRITTPKGYSCLFTPPLYAENDYFTCMAAVVDTDTYNLSIRFPFILKDPNFEGIIPAGTPMIQVIPFKRDDWQKKVLVQQQKTKTQKQETKLRSKMENSYKQFFRQAKSYK